MFNIVLIFVGTIAFLFIGFILYKLRRGTFVKFAYGGDSVLDLGDIGSTTVPITGATQTVRLLKINKDNDYFFILEIRILGGDFRYTKITREMVDNLVTKVSALK